jgi:hypothetical protein
MFAHLERTVCVGFSYQVVFIHGPVSIFLLKLAYRNWVFRNNYIYITHNLQLLLVFLLTDLCVDKW